MSIQDVTDSACSHSSKSLNFIRKIKFVLSRFVAVTLMLTYMSWLPKATLLPLLRRSGKVLRSILLFTDERRQNHLSSRLHCSCLTKEWWWVYLYQTTLLVTYPSCLVQAGRRASWAGRRAPPCSRTSCPGFGQGCDPSPLLPAPASCTPDTCTWEDIWGEDKLLKPATNNKSLYLIVEIGHVPSILLIIVVVGIGAVVAWCNALSVGGGSSVVEVHSISTMGAFGSRS